MTPEQIEKTLKNGSAAHTNPEERSRTGGLDKLDHRGITGP
ncbi:hypothetical protein ACWZJV_20110 [Nocardioides sp. WG-D5]